ncbi:MAG: hypothetical protein KatS3mg008_1630 [Acidimicrobiales bacterium]|nr:MAG: hypothetical protein KatS3mg008_1630 [Acidimicrobiales bacterium]
MVTGENARRIWDLSMAAGYAVMGMFWSSRRSGVLTLFSLLAMAVLVARALKGGSALGSGRRPAASAKSVAVPTASTSSPRLGRRDGMFGAAPLRAVVLPESAGVPVALIVRLASGRGPDVTVPASVAGVFARADGRLPDHRGVAGLFRDSVRIEHHRHAALVEELRRFSDRHRVPRRLPRRVSNEQLSFRVAAEDVTRPSGGGLARAA